MSQRSDVEPSTLAVDRSDWANERTLLAKERSYSAWIRTGLAALAAGIGIVHLLGDSPHTWLVLSLGSVLAAAGLVAPMLGFWSYRKSLKQLEQEGVRSLSIVVLTTFTLLIIVASVFAGILIFL